LECTYGTSDFNGYSDEELSVATLTKYADDPDALAEQLLTEFNLDAVVVDASFAGPGGIVRGKAFSTREIEADYDAWTSEIDGYKEYTDSY
jgi:hypothetical protein